MPIKIHTLNSSKDLFPFIKAFESITKTVELVIERLLPVIGDVDVVFYNNPDGALKESGIGGYTPCANIVFFSIDPKNPNFRKKLKAELSFQLAHEINHAIRFRTPIAKETLLEAMVSEGLADHFAMEVTRRKKPPAWSTALTIRQKKIFLIKASKVWNLSTYDHAAWFYGSKTKNIPRWTAYTLGYDLVSDYFKKHPGVKASKIISANAKWFV